MQILRHISISLSWAGTQQSLKPRRCFYRCLSGPKDANWKLIPKPEEIGEINSYLANKKGSYHTGTLIKFAGGWSSQKADLNCFETASKLIYFQQRIKCMSIRIIRKWIFGCSCSWMDNINPFSLSFSPLQEQPCVRIDRTCRPRWCRGLQEGVEWQRKIITDS